LRLYETKKLFWDEYYYKISLANSLAPIFREKHFAYSKKVLDELQQQQDTQVPLSYYSGIRRVRQITDQSFRDAKVIFNLLTNYHDDYKLRIESSSLNLYTNDINLIDNIKNKVSKECVKEIWQPNKTHLKNLKKGIILVDECINFEYKVTFGYKDFDYQSFAKWIHANLDKVKIGKTALADLETSGYVNNHYFYVKNDKVLQLIYLLCSNIRRVDKIVCKKDLDK